MDTAEITTELAPGYFLRSKAGKHLLTYTSLMRCIPPPFPFVKPRCFIFIPAKARAKPVKRASKDKKQASPDPCKQHRAPPMRANTRAYSRHIRTIRGPWREDAYVSPPIFTPPPIQPLWSDEEEEY